MKQIEWNNNILYLLDQRKLPAETAILECKNHHDVCMAIKTLAVRGAPLIGVAAAMGLVLSSIANEFETAEELRNYVESAEKELRSTRPTAVNLMWALDRMLTAIDKPGYLTAESLRKLILEEAMAIWEEDCELCRLMGINGAAVIPDNANIITHCNTGSLAASGDGTALSVIRQAHRDGKKIHVFVDETRPLLQGARLTAWELSKDGIPYTLITDNMAAHVMKEKKIDLAITGADRIAANGDSANKIGTYGLAVIAKAHNVPFYIAAPYSTIDLGIKSGKEIVIEQRDPDEVRFFGSRQTAPENCNVYNPAFDVTPAELIRAIITDRGIIEQPFATNLKQTLCGV